MESFDCVISVSYTHLDVYKRQGVGFLLAMVIFSGMRSKLDGNDDIPAPFQGVPITMTTAALLSLAFMGFGGLV